MKPGIVLASRSAQRRAILDQLGVAFEAVAPDVDELVEGEPRALVVENALRKARAVGAERVLGADTAVALNGRVFGKPCDRAQAREFLEALSGSAHEVWSGVALLHGGVERVQAAMTRVTFRSLRRAEVDWYLASGEWRGRAGGYAIQARGAALVERVEGDYTTVVGLPVSTLIGMAPDLLWPAER